MRKLVAEFTGTLWLVLGGRGSALLAAGYPELGIGFVGVAIAFGLTVVTMAYAIGHISGCHLNFAVSIDGRFDRKELLPYIISQVLGGIAGAGILFLIVSGKSGFEIGGFAANGYGSHSPDGYGLFSALTTEIIMTFMFLIIILGATHPKAPKNFAGLAIGLALTLIHLISIRVTNASVNPARSTSQALFVGDWALDQLWLFWLAPIVGAILAKSVFGRSIKENSLTVVKGIGPKIQSLFYKNNIRSWSALADCNIRRCQEILDAGGNSFSMHDPATWPEQARLAAEGEWKELHDWQNHLIRK